MEPLEPRVLLSANPTGLAMDAGLATFDQPNGSHWEAIAVDQHIEDPVVVAGAPTHQGSQPAMSRLRNVTTAVTVQRPANIKSLSIVEKYSRRFRIQSVG